MLRNLDAVKMTDMQPDTRGRQGVWINAALALLFVMAALPIRLRALDVFVTPDEMKWVCRSVNFYRGLRSGDLAETRQTGHPGVITMWLGVPWTGVDPTEGWLEICRNPSMSDIIESTSPQTPARLAALLFAGRRGVAVLTSLAIGFAFLLLVRLFDRRVALLASALLLCDPFYLAHSRLLHLDAIITSLLFLSILSLAVAVRDSDRRFMMLGGVLAGLAALNKSPAMFVLPFGALVIGLDWLTLPERHVGRLVRDGLLWCLSAVLVYVLGWPAMWVQPVETLRLVFGTALFYASSPHTNSNYFFGAPRPDPGWAFYPVAFAFRLTPWTMLGGILGLPTLVRRGKWRKSLDILAGFALLYLLFMTLGQKKFDRYLLPVFPFVETIAAVGLLNMLKWVGARWHVGRRGATSAVLLTLAVLVLSGATVLPHAPYYLTYYNPVCGGAKAAVRTLLVGWGEGLDKAAVYLNALPGSEQKRATARALTDFAPFFHGRSYDEGDYDPATTDYVVMYLNEVQRRLSPALSERYYDVVDPLYVARIKGINYAWVYENRTHEDAIRYINEHADPKTDAIAVSRPSLFTNGYQGALSVYVLDPEWSRHEILTALQQVARQADRVWYVRYAEKNPNPMLEWIDFQWRTHAFLLDKESLIDIDLFLWRTDEAISFGDASDLRREVDVRFGDKLTLKGYKISPAAGQCGRSLGVILEWQPLVDLDAYYADFVHVLDEKGRRWGHGDHWMVDENLLPTVTWKQGDLVQDHVMVTLAPGIAPDTYQLVMGVYDRVTQDELSVESSGGPSAVIGTVQVLSSPHDVDVEALPIQQRCQIDLSPALRLLGWGISEEAPGFGGEFSVDLFWRATQRPAGDHQVLLEVIGEEGRCWAKGVFPLASSEYPTSHWREGEVLWRPYDLEIAADARAGKADLRLTLLDSNGHAVGASWVLTKLDIDGHHFAAPSMEHYQEALIGEAIRFLGYNVQPKDLKAGDTLGLTLYWRADDAIAASYTVFTHLLDESGVVRGQWDSVPRAGSYPTSQWQSGEIVVDRYQIPLDADAPSGPYRVEIGMYDPIQGMRRVPLFAEGVRQQDDRLLLNEMIRVGP